MYTPSKALAVFATTLTAACVGRTDLGMLDDTGSTGATDGTEDASASQGGTDSTTTAGTTTATTSGTSTTGEPMGPAPSAVDILFVVDNSGSMGPLQARLSAAIHELTDVLMQNEISFRIGVTTTDNGNVWCQGTTPEGGSLRMTSCRTRQQDFMFSGPTLFDATEQACLDVCGLDQIEITPTTTANDPTAKPRPWIEYNGPGDTNIGDTDVVLALSCALPQGINGCGFEQPLESMYKALKRMQIEAESSYDFLRDDANLVVVVVTDEVDCSHNSDHNIIFLPEGNRVFWSLPDEGSPTSSVCWNAGVECTGGPGTYDECHAADKNVDGEATDLETEAVLRPVQRYIDFVSSLPNYAAGERAKIYAVSGVPVGGGPPVYADGTDPTYQTDFGIGPGCTDGDTRAVPPVRIREVTAAVNGSLGDGLISVCETTWEPAFQAIGQEIVAWTEG